MGKNHKHKKRLKAEKSKTQLKNAAKELLKRQNVTKTEFKIKPIFIMPQLTSKTTEDGRKDLTVDDVLNRLNHRNENLLVKACQDMEFLITQNKIQNIPYYFKYVCVFIQEDLSKGRKAGLKLIQTMLSKVEEKNVCSSLFEFLLNHLRCAMTSINKRIKEDSVLFFDLLLQYLPNLMAKHFSHFLPDFMMLISSLKNDAELRRTVTINLESKFTSSQWRIAVLSRLYKLLDVVLKRKIEKDKGLSELIEMHERYPLYVIKANNWNKALIELDDATKEDDENDVVHQFSNLYLILYETWLEGRPVKSSTSDTTLLTEEAAMLFNCVVQTFNVTASYLRSTKGTEKLKTFEHAKLLRSLVQCLPYGLIKAPKKTDKISDLLSKLIISDLKCTNSNILVCYNYLLLFAANPSKAKTEEINNVANTIMSYLNRDYSKNKKMDFSVLFSILKHLFCEKARLWCRNKFPVNDVLDNALNMYYTGNLEDDVKFELTELLSSITYEDLLSNKNLTTWFEDLPKLLLNEKISGNLLVILINRLRNCGSEQNVSFCKGILDNYVKIYDHLPNLEITGMGELDVKNHKLHIAQFITYLHIPNPQLQKTTKALKRTNPYWKEICYVIQ